MELAISIDGLTNDEVLIKVYDRLFRRGGDGQEIATAIVGTLKEFVMEHAGDESVELDRLATLLRA